MSLAKTFSSFSINILDKQINCSIPENVFLHNVFDMHPIVNAPDASILIEECRCPLKTDVSEKKGFIDIKISGEEAFNMNVFRSCVGYIVHKHTPAVFLHGCGLYSLVKNKGILIAGHERSGKTVLSRQIHASYIIDDDQMLLNGDELMCIGNKAAHTVQKRKIQNVVYERSKYLNAELGLVLRLNRELEGGTVKKATTKSVLKDASLIWHHNISFIKQPEDFCKGKAVPEVPTFIIGTNENKNKTIEVVLDIINSKL